MRKWVDTATKVTAFAQKVVTGANHKRYGETLKIVYMHQVFAFKMQATQFGAAAFGL